MTKVAIFTPTKRMGGMDVIYASLKRQTYRNFDLFVVDECERDYYWQFLADENGITVTCIKPPFIKYERNLARGYNLGMEYASEGGYDLLVSLQDYLWIPPDGLERFVKLFEGHGDRSLLTGLTSIAGDPTVEEIYDIDAPWTIFKDDYLDQPKSIKWRDVRETEIYNQYFDRGEYILSLNDPNHFEANWAAVPVELFNQGLKWDEDYDKGIAFENNQLALDAIVKYDCQIVLDGKNHAISLPHKDYFPVEEKEVAPNKRNMDKYLTNFMGAAKEGK